MDSDRARHLLAVERTRIEQAISALDRDGPQEASDRKEPGDEDSEDLYQDEFNADRAEDLHQQLAALERAEARLAGGTYGHSVEAASRFRINDSRRFPPPNGLSRSRSAAGA